MRVRSTLSNLCFMAAGLFVCLVWEGLVRLSFPGAGFLPLLLFTAVVWFCGYIRARQPSLRSITSVTLVDWLLAIPLGGGLLVAFLCHMLWLQVVVLLAVFLYQMRRDFAFIRNCNAALSA